MPNVRDFIGIPFVYGGRDKATGLDCYGLVKTYYRDVLGIDVPDVDHYDRDMSRNEIYDRIRHTEWQEVKDIQTNDVVTFNDGAESTDAVHCGVYVDGRVLHTTEKTGAILSRFSLLRKRIVGIHRLCRA
jgi:peptidoglycan DL-endopeptidase CwlO